MPPVDDGRTRLMLSRAQVAVFTFAAAAWIVATVVDPNVWHVFAAIGFVLTALVSALGYRRRRAEGMQAFREARSQARER